MPDIHLPCSACKQKYPMGNLKCSRGSDALTCFSCLEGKSKTSSGSSFSLGRGKPSLSSPDWPVVGPSNLVNDVSRSSPVSQSQRQQRPAGKSIQYRCANCSYSFSKHEQTQTTLRCPYCSKTSVRRVSYAVNEVDSLAGY
ncbi:TPA: hypothetical protein HA249_01660 [Candidatus Woesearchaeota archaeon]|nr:hypothetical protein [Candidatus Woesearchaeota archaeon]